MLSRRGDRTIGPALVELVVLFIGVPLALRLWPGSVPKLPTLILALAYVLARLMLFTRETGGWKWLVASTFGRPQARWLRGVLLRALVVFFVCLGLVMLLSPATAFALPRQRPGFWPVVLVLYPVLSVLPQEIIFRLYFFQRFEKVCHGYRPLLILLNAFCFSWLHIIYIGWFAMVSTFVAGFFLARSYARSSRADGGRTLLPVLVEHSLYGQIIFSVGLGRYFYLTA